MKAPILFSLDDLIFLANTTAVEIDGEWVPARPVGYNSLRLRLATAWGVFTGKYDAVKWPGGQ